jgi:hypothetical protein
MLICVLGFPRRRGDRPERRAAYHPAYAHYKGALKRNCGIRLHPRHPVESAITRGCPLPHGRSRRPASGDQARHRAALIRDGHCERRGDGYPSACARSCPAVPVPDSSTVQRAISSSSPISTRSCVRRAVSQLFLSIRCRNRSWGAQSERETLL